VYLFCDVIPLYYVVEGVSHSKTIHTQVVTFLQVDNKWLSITRGIEFDIQLFFSFSQENIFFLEIPQNATCLFDYEQTVTTYHNKGANIMRMNTSVEW